MAMSRGFSVFCGSLFFTFSLVLLCGVPAVPLFAICRHPGCGCRIEFGERFCEKHKADAAKRYEPRKRLTAHQRGYTSRWRRVSQEFLKAHPLCAECERQGRITPATCVDHIKPHRGDFHLFWDQSNWQPLCTACHSRKTAAEDGGFGNKVSRNT